MVALGWGQGLLEGGHGNNPGEKGWDLRRRGWGGGEQGNEDEKGQVLGKFRKKPDLLMNWVWACRIKGPLQGQVTAGKPSEGLGLGQKTRNSGLEMLYLRCLSDLSCGWWTGYCRQRCEIHARGIYLGIFRLSLILKLWGFPGGAGGKEPTCQRRVM